MTTCTTMRAAVLLSVALLLSGGLALLVAEGSGLSVPIGFVSLWLVLGAAATLAGALLIALWPGNQSRLSECQH